MADWPVVAGKVVAAVVIGCVVAVIVAGTLWLVAWLLSAGGTL